MRSRCDVFGFRTDAPTCRRRRSITPRHCGRHDGAPTGRHGRRDGEVRSASRPWRLIERYRVDCATFVPTHFVRMLKLPPEVRGAYDVSSLRSAVHAAAPARSRSSRQMIDWWGPVLNEYYAGTEGNRHVLHRLGTSGWRTRFGGQRGVRRAAYLRRARRALPPRTEGVVYFAGGGRSRLSQRPGEDGGGLQPARLVARSATSAGSTRTATST